MSRASRSNRLINIFTDEWMHCPWDYTDPDGGPGGKFTVGADKKSIIGWQAMFTPDFREPYIEAAWVWPREVRGAWILRIFSTDLYTVDDSGDLVLHAPHKDGSGIRVHLHGDYYHIFDTNVAYAERYHTAPYNGGTNDKEFDELAMGITRIQVVEWIASKIIHEALTQKTA